MNKYHAVKQYSELCGRTFDSRAECRRGEELALMERGGVISNLDYQPSFILSLKPKVTYTADFDYIEDGVVIVEDVKGILTRETRVKIAWVKEKFGIEVKLTK